MQTIKSHNHSNVFHLIPSFIGGTINFTPFQLFDITNVLPYLDRCLNVHNCTCSSFFTFLNVRWVPKSIISRFFLEIIEFFANMRFFVKGGIPYVDITLRCHINIYSYGFVGKPRCERFYKSSFRVSKKVNTFVSAVDITLLEAKWL